MEEVNAEFQALAKERAALHAAQKESKEQNQEVEADTDKGRLVKLNVGGKKYMTLVSTLQAEPHSMLAVMFSGRHSLLRDDKGNIFLDRDGELFRFILEWLRSGTLAV